MATYDILFGRERTYPLARLGEQNALIDLVWTPRRNPGEVRQLIKSDHGHPEIDGPNFIHEVSLRTEFARWQGTDFTAPEHFQEALSN